MTWFVLIIWFEGGKLADVQVNLPFPSLETCGQAIEPIRDIYESLDIQASYHCVPVPTGEPA